MTIQGVIIYILCMTNYKKVISLFLLEKKYFWKLFKPFILPSLCMANKPCCKGVLFGRLNH